MTAAERIRRAARALSVKIDDPDESRYVDIIACVLQADAEANGETWDVFAGELASAAKEAAERLIERRTERAAKQTKRAA